MRSLVMATAGLLFTASLGERALAQSSTAPLTAAAPVATATPRESALTLAEVLSSIDRDHPAVAAARQDKAAARGDRTAADGGFDTAFRTRVAGTPLSYYRNFRVDTVVEQPTALWGSTVFGGYRLGRGDVPDYDGKQLTNELGEVRAGLVVPTIRNGPIDRRRANRERGALGETAAGEALRAATLDVKRVGGLRYWEWVAAGKRREIARTLLDIALKRDAQIASRVVRGDLSPIERTENARVILQRRVQLVAQDRGLQQAAIELSQYYRAPGGGPVVPSDDRLPALEEPTVWPAEALPTATARALAERPDVRRIALVREQARVEADLANNQRLPALDFQVVVSKDFGGGIATRRPVELEGQVLLDVPIQNRQANGRAEAARAALARVAEQERGARDRVTAEVRDARSASELARSRLALARQEVEISAELERAEWLRFAAGDTTLLVVNLREQATFDARLRQVDALAECQRALMLLRAAMGSLK
ncbi:MAG: TolC family protein [Myxococcales bacterium]|nr:TolC family protein [Myxococcales bacterium]